MKQISILDEIIVDNFAGGGGFSTGAEMAVGHSVEIAIDHDPDAIAMHKANHPETEHYQESVWDIDPVKVIRGRPVGLAWFSPDCKHFSRAKGKTPVNKNIRGLAWVAVRWGATVKPRVIMLENVEEFKTWGPVIKDAEGNLYPDPKRKGWTFEHFIKSLKKLGYKVDYRELRACDYGAPTIRKRFFLIARRDGRPIIWPKPTHAIAESDDVKSGKLKPYRSAAEIIDWSIPCKSIFERKKPLNDSTMNRIAKGIQKFIINNPRPYIVDDKAMVLIQMGYGDPEGKRALDLNKPLGTITAGGNKFGLVTAFISTQFKSSIGHTLEKPLATVTTVNKNALVMAFLVKYYGCDIGQSLSEPLHTVTTKDRFGLVTIQGEDYKIVDIGFRMLQPRELFNAQGFPSNYIIDHDYTGKPYPKTAQVARCGNAVPPQFAEALVRANLPELCEGNGKFREAI